MSLLAGLTTDESIKDSKDSVGGGFTARPSGIYDALVKVAYITVATSGAKALNIIADINGAEYRETIYITNKQGKNFYVSDDGTAESKVQQWQIPNYGVWQAVQTILSLSKHS